MKSFEIKLYDRLWDFKKMINPLDVKSEISFSEDLEGWQAELSLSVNWDFGDFVDSDIIEIREVDDVNKTVSMTYTWIIEETEVDEYELTEVITIQLLWVFTALNDVIFRQGWLRTFTVNMTPWNLVKAIIDSFNLSYGNLVWDTQNLATNLIKYDGSSIDVTWTAVNYAFDNDYCIDAIKKALEDTGFSFYIWADWLCYVQQDANQTKVSLTMWNQVVKVNRKKHKRDMVNTYFLKRTGGVEVTYTDAWAATTFWPKEKAESDEDIQDVTTQDTVWTKFVQDYAYERNEISVLVKPQKSESIRPWMLLTVNNIRNTIVEKKITKIDKSKEQWIIYVGDFISFWKEILKK